MNNKHKKNYVSKLTRQLIAKYLITNFIFIITTTFFSLAVWYLCSTYIWQPHDTLWILFSFIRDHLVVFLCSVWLLGSAIITFIYIRKPLKYLDSVIVASEELASPRIDPIVLPAELENVETHLNYIKDSALRNATLAKEAEQRKLDLIVYLAHDLKTPLTSIIGYLTLLNDEPDISIDNRSKYTGIALDKAIRLEDLINEFFDITRFNLTTILLEPEITNLSRMVSQIASEFNVILHEKNLSWKFNIQPDISILCDRDKMERVFDNLIRNAINYSYPNAEIQLSLMEVNNEAVFLVQNHGKNIPKEKLSHIFEQFYRVDSSRSSSTGGAGLGLAISKEIVELHNGTISATSVNEHVSFTLKLPLVINS